VRETFVCGICLKLMFDPTTLPCRHSGCLQCMKRALQTMPAYNRKCPICNAPMAVNAGRDLSVSIGLREAMQSMCLDWIARSDAEYVFE
jgi:Zn finger protein HypA/HybF involved in hydrogenase expression